ncbi:MAG: malic enzyme-like NAD(P)-binding protein [Woeseiaceae bacterium]|nr:malic enzyme-like NAD(P)-binding protein [Woeseiaceae bacterium]
MFNDDIQGTAAATLAGIYAANRITGKAFADLRILFLEARRRITGIAGLMARAFESQGLSGRRRIRLRLVDRDGLVTADREGLDDWLEPFAPECEAMEFHRGHRDCSNRMH